MSYLPQIKSRVSRRIFVSILLCAVIPISALVILTLHSVRNNLEADIARRLHHAGKNIGMAIFSELTAIDEVQRRASALYPAPDKILPLGRDKTLFNEDVLLELAILPLQKVSATEQSEQFIKRMTQGAPQLLVKNKSEQLELSLWSPSTSADGKPVVVVGKLNLAHLEDKALNFLPVNTRLLIVDENFQPLLGEGPKVLARDDLFLVSSKLGHKYAEIKDVGESWIVGQWDLFLKAGFNSPEWNILVWEPKSEVYSPLNLFARNAWLTGALTLWVALLASSILIRNTLRPLQHLKEATREIGRGRFDYQLQLNSRDEFEEVSNSFNQMAVTIQRQVNQQQEMGQAVRQILGGIGREEIITGFLHSIDVFEKINMISLSLIKRAAAQKGKSWIVTAGAERKIDSLGKVRLGKDELSLLLQTEFFDSSRESSSPTILKPLLDRGGKLFSIFHVEFKADFYAVVCLSHADSPVDSDKLIAKQLVSQMGVALSRDEMMNELDELNFGILTALARTVDANSPWTLGHSERVTQYAMALAETMELGEDECLAIHQAGLLHDLGKVAVPSEVLNKPAKLTEEEFAMIRRHPSEADRILEPIRAFKGVRQIVRQHHERWDGGGYPDQLQGTEINLGARILAVADVYDALYSDRPYRSSWNKDKVLDYLESQAGIAFDPTVIAALQKSVCREPF